MKGKGFGVVGDIVIGIIGALIGGFLFRLLGISTDGGLLGSLIVAVIGAVVLLWLLRPFKKTASQPPRAIARRLLSATNRAGSIWNIVAE